MLINLELFDLDFQHGGLNYCFKRQRHFFFPYHFLLAPFFSVETSSGCWHIKKWSAHTVQMSESVLPRLHNVVQPPAWFPVERRWPGDAGRCRVDRMKAVRRVGCRNCPSGMRSHAAKIDNQMGRSERAFLAKVNSSLGYRQNNEGLGKYISVLRDGKTSKFSLCVQAEPPWQKVTQGLPRPQVLRANAHLEMVLEECPASCSIADPNPSTGRAHTALPLEGGRLRSPPLHYSWPSTFQRLYSVSFVSRKC